MGMPYGGVRFEFTREVELISLLIAIDEDLRSEVLKVAGFFTFQ